MQWYLNFHPFCYCEHFKWPSIFEVLCCSPPLERFCWPESNISNHYANRNLYLQNIFLGSSLRADEIKLWLTPSAKKRRNPCSGLPAVYPDLSTATIGQIEKAFVLFVVIANQVEGEFKTYFR